MRKLMSFLSFLGALVCAFIAMNTPPYAVIDSSVLWFTAQLLVFCASLIGIDFKITDITNVFKAGKDSKSQSDRGSE